MLLRRLTSGPEMDAATEKRTAITIQEGLQDYNYAGWSCKDFFDGVWGRGK
jgi:hypothetical protein